MRYGHHRAPATAEVVLPTGSRVHSRTRTPPLGEDHRRGQPDDPAADHHDTAVRFASHPADGSGCARPCSRPLRAYDAVLFGRAVPARERDTVRRALADAGAEVPCVDALAPVVPLLVAQTEQALEAGRGDRRRLTGLTVTGSTALFEVVSAGRVRLTAHRIDRLSRARSRDLFDGLLAPGRHRVPLDARRSGEAYVVARTAGTVLVAAARP